MGGLLLPGGGYAGSSTEGTEEGKGGNAAPSRIGSGRGKDRSPARPVPRAGSPGCDGVKQSRARDAVLSCPA